MTRHGEDQKTSFFNPLIIFQFFFETRLTLLIFFLISIHTKSCSRLGNGIYAETGVIAPQPKEKIMSAQATSADLRSLQKEAGPSLHGHNAGISFSIEQITPEMARAYLEARPEGYDPEMKRSSAETRTIAGYSEAMRAGGWIMNGMPIIFDQNGRLVDGESRLLACIMADTPFETLVARNVQSDSLHTIDQHRRRSYTGVLEARGVRNAGAVQRTMSKLIRIENGILGKQNLPISWSRYDRVFSANPLLIEAVATAEDMRGSSLHSTPRPVLIFMALKSGLRREIRKFMAAMSDPEAFDPTNPAVILANQMDTIRDSGGVMDVDKALALSILAFNDFLDGTPRRKPYSWDPDYGEGRVKDGLVTNWKVVRDTAPPNLGLPKMKGYPGLDEGVFDIQRDADDFAGRLADVIREGIDTGTGHERVEMRLITPDLAEKWLQRFNTENRKIQRSHVEMIVRDIRDGNWMVNAQPICFTGDPDTAEPQDDVRLLNGQHRLEACKISEIPIEIPIAKNIPEAAFATYDIHAKKALKGPGSAARTDDRVLKAAAKILWRVDEGYPATYKITPSASELMKTIQAHPHLADGFARARRMKEFASAGVMTYLIYRVTQEYPEIGQKFLDDLESGEGLERGNPVIKARTQAIGQRGKRNRKETIEDLEMAWKEYKAYKGVKNEEQHPFLTENVGDDLFEERD